MDTNTNIPQYESPTLTVRGDVRRVTLGRFFVDPIPDVGLGKRP